jgi:hypothetical protein
LVNLDTRQRPVQHPAPSADADIAIPAAGCYRSHATQPAANSAFAYHIGAAAGSDPAFCYLGSLLHAKVSDYCQLYQR